MRGRVVFLAVAAAWVSAAGWSGLQAAPGQSASPASPLAGSAAAPDSPALLKKYCVTCHNPRLKTGGLSLDGLDPALADEHGDLWELSLIHI